MANNREYESGALPATPPPLPAAPSVGYPTNGDPVAGTPATVPGAQWFHQIGEEIRSVIEGAGLVPSSSDLGQLLASMQSLFASLDANDEVTQLPAGAAASKALASLRADGSFPFKSFTLPAGYDVSVWDDNLVSGQLYSIRNPQGLVGWYYIEVFRYGGDTASSPYRMFRATSYGSGNAAGLAYTRTISNGVDTGWILNPTENNMIETVVNANGTALKFADGTMICLASPSSLGNFGAYTTGIYSRNLNYIWAASFISPPEIAGGEATSNVGSGWLGGGSSTVSSGTMIFFTGTTTLPTTINGKIIAIGRWK